MTPGQTIYEAFIGALGFGPSWDAVDPETRAAWEIAAFAGMRYGRFDMQLEREEQES